VLADEVFAWLAAQPEWQRDLARRLATKVQLDGEEYDDAVRMVKAQFRVPTVDVAPTPQPIERDDLKEGTTGSTTRLLSLGSMRGVGLLGDDQELRFAADGLTIVYGQNAAGKSSYVRALKVLCRAVDRGCTVRGSIFDAAGTGTVPSAKIKIKSDGDVLERRTSLDESRKATLPGMSVFDATCAELYVDAQNTVQYIPAELRLLARLGALQDQIRHDLVAERQALQSTEPAVDAYPPTTAVAHALRQLRGHAADPDLESLATLTDAQRARILELKGIVAAAAGSTIRDDAHAAKREAEEARALVTALVALAERATESAAERLRRAAQDDEDAGEAVRLATVDLTGPVSGIGGGPWRIMWEAARSFVAAGGGSFPPRADDVCPLCLQPVSGDTAEHLAHFNAHVTSTAQETARRAADTFQRAMEAANAVHPDTCRTPLLAALHDREPKLAYQIDALIGALADHLSTMRAAPKTAAAAAFDLTPVIAALNRWAHARDDHANVLLDADDPEKLRQVTAELADLEARERLASELETFRSWQTTLRTITGLTAAHSALATNRVTSAQRELTETEISKALDASLTEELQRLSCTHLPVQLATQTHVAETMVRLALLAPQTADLSEIASEGEQRALALCFFFAELAVANDGGGIIVDDPVSSLDDERRGYIAQRLVHEAQQRQVIVFTHDLPFVFELRALAKKVAVPMHVQHVWRRGNDVGRVDDHPPFKTMNLRERIGKLEAEVCAIRSMPPATSDDAWRLVDGLYKRIRTSWERAVEERLFAGVVERFERDVKTQSLKNVKITPELIKQVDDGMTRASRYVHEDAFAAQVPLPSAEDMVNDVTKLREFEKQTRGG
jgi:ABC-type transport system involved in cytochrome c biogenesis ATPase subunit